MNASLRIFLAGLLIGVLAVVAWLGWRNHAVHPLPDEKKAAMELLTETQGGPRYFHASGTKPDEEGIVWIDPAAARGQVDGIIEARKLDGSAREKILKLIDEACEPPQSRVVGGERIRLAKLNLALDSLP